jgi:hypothetical protein
MRIFLFLVCVLGLSCASLAQTNQASWANLSTLHPEQSIQITDAASKTRAGTLLNVSDTAISFSDISGEKSVQKQDVRSVKLMENTHRLRNTLIGAGVGAGVLGGIGAATSCSTDHCLFGRGLGASIGAVIGGLGGAAVGAVLPSHTTIYSASAH